MIQPLDWDRDGRNWPHREASRFVQSGGLRWHVQQMGTGPIALLLHGTGASTHSWRSLMPLLAPSHTLMAIDLPGHAFTETPPVGELTLQGMANAVATLVHTLELEVSLLIGHSAGAAIGARMVLDGQLSPKHLIAINGAFLPLAGLPGLLFPPVAKLMAAIPIAPQLFARRSWDQAALERLIGGTGSSLDAEGLALYGMLVRNAGHAAGALAMMARWDLRPLAHDLAGLRTPFVQIVGAKDRAVPPHYAHRVRALVPASTPCRIDFVPGAGHLVHEERPNEVAGHILAAVHADQGMPA